MNILIVDDNDDNRMTIELLLEDFNELSIDNAVDGEDAVKQCREKHYDLIFMDIMMPVMNGIEATKVIKKFDKKSMVIALSALDDDSSKQAMLQNGAEDYMTKPIESELFVQRVKNYIDIISKRIEGAVHSRVFMLFNEKVYPSSMTFWIDSENALAYFWGYYLNDQDSKAEDISDVVRMIYGFGLWMLKNGEYFRIIVEENDEQLFITQLDIQVISEHVIKNILLHHCSHVVYIVKDQTVSFRLNKNRENIPLIKEEEKEKEEVQESASSDYTKEILAKTHFNKTTAAEYVEQSAIAFMDKIDSLEVIENSIDEALTVFEKESSVENINDVARNFFDYVEILELLVEFEHLSFALNSLAEFLQGTDTTLFEASEISKFVTLSIHMLDDLKDWRENIFVKQEANDIHYLDSSLLSSCLQIETIFNKDASEEDEGELEFF